ncbi:unnamed protein product [Rotaria sp. Silwood1]|nr:unnamed protein product [Rotaria sp. Silwood1]CAF3502298.1 unnamed protein product [Rotaria sp. Silwood1]CAF3506801.1 unnamed protein product [Rotaria sp. Silwood1]CAF4559374.1 unnamed protein product [Rotaria sp. Silwood1]CAF4576096.1 unnamed protein product [Rotaria sp. Silwood1]
MKIAMKHTNREIELSIWQLFALIIAAIACLFAIVPFISRYQSNECDMNKIDNAVEPQSYNSDVSSDYHRRYVRDVGNRDQCNIVPPICSPATTTITTPRSTVSTVSVTRPVITNFPTSTRTTTLDPWANTSRPYDSWRLPNFAKPIDYTLHFVCPYCYTWSESIPIATFHGKVTIRIDILNATQYLILHAKNLNITQAKLIGGSGNTATVTYLPEFEMVHLDFSPTPISTGQITLEIDYTGEINEEDNTGFYREWFWKTIGELSYILAGNFQPTHARKAFPCFDEPSMQAKFILTIEHPQNSTIALSNSAASLQTESLTTFEATPIMSTYSFSWAVLPLDEFETVTQNFSITEVNIWVRPELIGASNQYLNWTFEVVEETLNYLKTYLNLSDENIPTKLDLIGVPDLIVDERASASWGLLTFREELLSTDYSLNSAERLQTRTKAIVEHIIQIWFSTTDWWDNIWFGKSLSSYLAYKMIEEKYPSFKLMEQFPMREMIPLMMDDFKPSIWPVSNKNLTNNAQILDYLSVYVYSKGTSFLRLLEYIVGNEAFQSAVQEIISIKDVSMILKTFYSKLVLPPTLNTASTPEEFLRSWLEEKNYPLVTVEFIPSNDTTKSTTINFRQARYYGSFASNSSSSNLNYVWKIYMECDLGGVRDENSLNLTDNHAPSKIKFMFESSNHTIVIPNEEYVWIKCNKDFYSYQVTEYLTKEADMYELWQHFVFLLYENVFSNTDKANILNDAFILPHGGEIVTYDETVSLVREMTEDPTSFYLPLSVFVWHWNYLMGVEEHSKYFYNFKQFATRHIMELYQNNIDNLLTTGANHQERLIKSLFFELLCRVQNTEALNKATELFRGISSNYFYNSTGVTNIDPDFLPTVIYYHIQNANDIDEWDHLWYNLTENLNITSQQRITFLRALGAAKEVWRLKSLLEIAADINSDLIETQEFFDLLISTSQNPNGRDVVWNFYRHNYPALLYRFGRTNRLFNQLIASIAQSFENKYYYQEMVTFINQNPSPTQFQQLAVDQIQMNFEWLVDGMAKSLDDAISVADKSGSKKKLN